MRCDRLLTGGLQVVQFRYFSINHKSRLILPEVEIYSPFTAWQRIIDMIDTIIGEWRAQNIPPYSSASINQSE